MRCQSSLSSEALISCVGLMLSFQRHLVLLTLTTGCPKTVSPTVFCHYFHNHWVGIMRPTFYRGTPNMSRPRFSLENTKLGVLERFSWSCVLTTLQFLPTCLFYRSKSLEQFRQHSNLLSSRIRTRDSWLAARRRTFRCQCRRSRCRLPAPDACRSKSQLSRWTAG